MSMQMSNRTMAAVACLVLGGLAARAPAETPHQSYELAAAASDPILWLVVGEADPKEKTFVNWLAYLERSATQIKPAIGFRPQIGQLARWTVVGDSLQGFYSDGTHQRYSRTKQRREVRLPGSVVPEAIAGETGGQQPLLWAVVRDETADVVEANWEKTRQSTRPAEEKPGSQPESRPMLTSRRSSGYSLVCYDGVYWRPGFTAPDALKSAQRMWLCTSGGRFHLLWQPKRDSRKIEYAWSDLAGWTAGPPISLSRPLQQAYVGVINAELVFAALVQEGEPVQLRPEALRRPVRAPESTYWSPSGAPKTGDGKAVTVPAGSAIAAFAGNLVVLRMVGGQPEIAFWDLAKGGAPDQPFHAIPVRREGSEPQRQRGTRDMATLLVIAVVLLLLLWWRQGGFPVAAALPPGITLAQPAKRFLGALIDIAPALAIVTWWWWQPLATLSSELTATNGNPDTLDVGWGSEIFWAGVALRVIYTLYSLVFELFWNRTPGKWLLGTMVISESLTPPTWLQICIRNVSRMIELEQNLLIWPFMVVLLVTRSRQRVGDLLARTLVIDLSLSGTETQA